ncbi:hypothetical protein BW723_15055 [Polaribacter reichenbachii]|uniref:DUF1569 domain-containing protein n=1 Tax=Polaribacter reichenbachii TaxID=996801 RepID=A0A1B8U4I9_9FLAO|nr:DUF1569 domain-containing protein [Polaribacter reichenbachii]APZ47523.1 hypothetical protein BW723_15055 [Polaribacter reichenbachii]AUC18162.1 hypothetical protein BTO17_05495 [Polaribacter reichenbachii]OBY66773.1 hypothetical protein LPB301_06125 [Polaribacter reichenbachii]
MKNIFEKEVTDSVINRIEKLTVESQPNWGKMSVAQMLAHCSVTYEMVYTDKHTKPNPFVKLMLKAFVKKAVVGEKPYPKNSRTAPQFIISDKREFELEKKRLIDFILKSQELGENYFDGKESLSFGKLNKIEWNNMFYKHLDHHLTQFGV